MTLLASLLGAKVAKFAVYTLALLSALVFFAAGVSNVVAQLVFPDVLTRIWNYMQMGRCADVIIGAYLSRWLMTIWLKVLDGMK